MVPTLLCVVMCQGSLHEATAKHTMEAATGQWSISVTWALGTKEQWQTCHRGEGEIDLHTQQPGATRKKSEERLRGLVLWAVEVDLMLGNVHLTGWMRGVCEAGWMKLSDFVGIKVVTGNETWMWGMEQNTSVCCVALGPLDISQPYGTTSRLCCCRNWWGNQAVHSSSKV